MSRKHYSAELQTSATDAAPADPHAGQGGSYSLDPLTGLRTLQERTDSTAGYSRKKALTDEAGNEVVEQPAPGADS